MIKRLLLLAVLFTVVSSYSFAQGTKNWKQVPFGNPAIDTLKGTMGAHGVTIDPDGKIWVAVYQPYKADSVLNPTTNTWTKVRPIWVFNPDGSPASFSPIKAWVNGSDFVPISGTSNTGINVNDKGNIVLANAVNLFMFDYKTGAGLYKYTDFPTGAGGINRPAIDAAGNVFISYVYPKWPIRMLNPDLTFNSNAVDTLMGYGRTLEVSKDGNSLYAGRYSIKAVIIYNRTSEFDPFVAVDTIKGFTNESQSWHPTNKLLYLGAGSTFDRPQTDPTIPGLFYPKATPFTHYGIDMVKKEVVDSIKWNVTSTSGDERPRGIVFSKDGSFAVLAEFNEGTIPCIQKHANTVGVVKENNAVVNSFELSQNFPNPFNPVTTIKFSVAKTGFVSLKVYDMLGKEVATLINEELSQGSYNTSFDASNLTSGMYVYQLSANGSTLSKKMTLLK